MKPTDFPEFFIVGQPKTGTTALYEMLDLHPQVSMCRVKEPKYFSARDQDGVRTGLCATDEEYLALYDEAQPGQVRGEASVDYLRSELAPGRIAAVRPDARIIAMVREPAALIRSLHLQLLKAGSEDEPDLGRALAREDGRPGSPRRYSGLVDYVTQLERWEQAFSREQLLVVIYDDYRRDNAAALRSIMRHIGVDESVELRQLESNRTVGPRRSGSNRAYRALAAGDNPLGRTVRSAGKLVLRSPKQRRFLRRRVQSLLLFSEPPPPDEQLLAELRARFAPNVAALADYLDRPDLPKLWRSPVA